MKDNLQKLALAFCKKCLHWDDAEDGKLLQIHSPIRMRNNQGGVFEYTFIGEIITQVHSWCEENFIEWLLIGNPRHDGDEKKKYLAIIIYHDLHYEGRCHSDDIRVALLSACLDYMKKNNVTYQAKGA